jgi:hypothetical protein
VRSRMPLILALVQVALAIVWKISDYLRPIQGHPWGTAADREFSVALNAPVTLVRALLSAETPSGGFSAQCNIVTSGIVRLANFAIECRAVWFLPNTLGTN